MNSIAQALAAAAGHLSSGRLAEAETVGRHVLAQGEHPGALHLLAVVAERQGKSGEAFALLDRAVRLVLDHPPLNHQRALALRKLGRFAEAADAFRRLLALDPGHTDGHAQLGIVLHALGDLAGAETAFRHAAALAPMDPALHANVGGIQRCRGNPDAAVHTRTALMLDPGYADAAYNLGVGWMQARRVRKAVQAYRRAIAVRPEHTEAHWNLSLALLALGELDEGWREYEWRWRRPETPPPAIAQPRWQGEGIAGRTILLHAEQGHGDTLQFVRYAPLVAARGARVLLVCQSALVRLLAGMPGVAGVRSTMDALPDFDLHCPLMGLPLVFRTTLETIPTDVPYLCADPAQGAVWRDRFAGERRPRVGLVWAGDARLGDPMANAVDKRRSVSLEALAPLTLAGDMAFVSLQKGPPAVQACTPPPGMALTDLMGAVADFADTAALVEQLDLVITVDTAVAHLAGALGKPVWVLSRFDGCWRWLLERDDSPWYPTMRLFRQESPGEWGPVIARVSEALSAWVSERGRG